MQKLVFVRRRHDRCSSLRHHPAQHQHTQSERQAKRKDEAGAVRQDDQRLVAVKYSFWNQLQKLTHWFVSFVPNRNRQRHGYRQRLSPGNLRSCQIERVQAWQRPHDFGHRVREEPGRPQEAHDALLTPTPPARVLGAVVRDLRSNQEGETEPTSTRLLPVQRYLGRKLRNSWPGLNWTRYWSISHKKTDHQSVFQEEESHSLHIQERISIERSERRLVCNQS